MAKVKTYDAHPANYIGFKCPGCANHHVLPTRPIEDAKETETAEWGFNGNFDLPTFRPSILERAYDGDELKDVCHSSVTDGRIYFYDDSTHLLKGKTADLEDFK